MDVEGRKEFDYIVNRVTTEYETVEYDSKWSMPDDEYDFVPLLTFLPKIERIAASATPKGETILIMAGENANCVIIDRGDHLAATMLDKDGIVKVAEITTLDQLESIIYT